MRLQDIPNGQAVILQIEWGTQIIEFPLEIAEKDTGSIFLTPHIYQGTPLKINIDSSSGIRCNLFTVSQESNTRIGWKCISVNTLNKSGNIVYHVTSNSFNSYSSLDERRESSRVLVHNNGKVYDVISDTYTDVIIHDVSDTGISFLAPNNFECKSPQPIVTLSDIIDGKEYIISVPVTLTRMQKKPGAVLYGCRVVGESRNFLIYGLLKKIKSKKDDEKGESK